MLCLCAYASVHIVKLDISATLKAKAFVKETQRLAIVGSGVSDSTSFISPVTVLFPEYIIESKTDLFACKQLTHQVSLSLSSCSFAIIALLTAFCAILNSTYQLSSFLYAGIQDPTFAFFCTSSALPPVKKVSQKFHLIFFAPPHLL